MVRANSVGSFLCCIFTLSKTSEKNKRAFGESVLFTLGKFEAWTLRDVANKNKSCCIYIHAALNEQKLFAIWRSHRWKVFVCWNSHKIGNLPLFFLPLAVEFVNVSFVGNAFERLENTQPPNSSTSQSYCFSDEGGAEEQTWEHLLCWIQPNSPTWTQRKTALLLSSHQALRLVPLVEPSLSFHFTVAITF